jgi:hypothetical protein
MKNPKLKAMLYRGADAAMVGATEPEWPSTEEQMAWHPSQRRIIVGAALDWYHATQDDRTAAEFLSQWLDSSPKRKPLAQIVRKHGFSSLTIGWLARCSSMGLELKLKELRHIQRILTAMVTDRLAAQAAQDAETPVETPRKPNIQERINEKIRECNGAVQGDFDDFITAGCTGDPDMIKLLIQYNVPQVRVKELVGKLTVQATEISTVLAGTDADLSEGYSNYGKRQLKSMIWWLTRAQEQMLSYGIMKAANRKPVSRKGQTPQKLVNKLKFMAKHEELKLESIDPVQILKATELWVYNVNRRKLGIYVADETQGALYVKNSRILGFSETKSVCKTIRKPDVQLKQFMSGGKPVSKQWFDDLKTAGTPLNGRITPEFLLLKAYK